MDKPVALLLQARPLLSKSKTFVAMLSVTIAPLKQTVVLSLTKSLEGTDTMVDVILRAVITCNYKLVTCEKLQNTPNCCDTPHYCHQDWKRTHG